MHLEKFLLASLRADGTASDTVCLFVQLYLIKTRQTLTFHRQRGSRWSQRSSLADSPEHSELVPGPHLPATSGFLLTCLLT